jgi:hypothetical protein
MNFRKAVLSSTFVLAIAGVASVAWVGGGAPAQAAPMNFTLVDVSGTVTGDPESVTFSGKARVGSRLAPDPDFNSPRFVLTIDMSNVNGTGTMTQKKYDVAATEVVQRRVASSHVVTYSFPFVENGKDGLEARAGKVSFALSFNLDTGMVTAASGSVGSLN